MVMKDGRLDKVNRGIDGGPAAHKLFPNVGAVRTDVDSFGRQRVRLYDDEYWLPIGDPINDEGLIWTSPSDKTIALQYDTQENLSVHLPPAVGKYGEPDDHVDAIGVRAEGGSTVLSAPMACMEYVASEDPESVVRLHCIERKEYGQKDATLRLALEHHHPEVIRRELQERIGKEAIATIDAFVQDVVDSTPDAVYHKCSVKTLVRSIKAGKYQKMDTDRYSDNVVKWKNMSTSDIHMPQRRLKTPWDNQRVSVKLRVPRQTCPLRVVYDLPADYRHNNWYSEDFRVYNNSEDALIDTYYSIRMKEALRERYPGCKRIGEDDIERKGKLPGYAYEREIFLIPEDGETVPFRPEDVVEIIAEGECRTSAGYVKAVLEEHGLDSLIPKVVDSEFCSLAGDLAKETNLERKQWGAEQLPWKWDNRLGRRYKSGERRPDRLELPPQH